MLVMLNMRLYIRRITEHLVKADTENSKIIKMTPRLKSELEIWGDHELKYLNTVKLQKI